MGVTSFVILVPGGRKAVLRLMYQRVLLFPIVGKVCLPVIHLVIWWVSLGFGEVLTRWQERKGRKTLIVEVRTRPFQYAQRRPENARARHRTNDERDVIAP